MTASPEEWLAATTALATALVEGVDETAALALATELAVRCSRAAGGALLLVEDGPGADQQLHIACSTGSLAQPDRTTVYAATGSGLAAALGSERALLDGEPGPLPGWLDTPPPGTTLLAPLRGNDGTLGVLALALPDTADAAENAELAGSFATQAALATAFGRAQRGRARLAVLEDRERIAKDLHDLVIQRLFATGLTLQGLGAWVQGEEGRRRLEDALDNVDISIRDLRRAIFHLRSDVNRQGLRARLEGELRSAAAVLGFEPELRLEGALDTLVPPDLADDVVAVLREALANIARHARATRAAVRVAVGGGRLAVEVDDDGVGPAADGRASGTANLAARAEAHSGTFALAPRDGGGTALRWAAPV